MATKNFIRHTRPRGKNEVKQTIGDIERQIKYWRSIGFDEYQIQYWSNQLVYLKKKLARLQGIRG